MKIINLKLLSLSFLLSFSCTNCTKDRDISKEPIELQDGNILIHYWDFNNNDTPESIVAPTISETTSSIGFFQNGSKLPYCDGGNQSCWESVNDGTIENAQNDSEAGRALRLRNPCSYLEIKGSTEGFGEIKLGYAIKRTGSGAQKNILQYTTDGTSYSTLGIDENEFSISEGYKVVSVDFKNVNGANNNPNFGIRILFEDGNNNNSGNNRLDNLTFIGKSF